MVEMNNPKNLLLVLISSVLFSCSSHEGVVVQLEQKIKNTYTPKQWSTSSISTASKQHWFKQLPSKQIQPLVEQAVANNFSLKQQSLALDIIKQQLLISGSALWPSIDLSLQSNRRKSVSTASSYSANVSLDLSLQYELDLWGKLSAAEQQVNLELMAEQASFEQATQQLAADVITAWFDVVETRQLLTLYQQSAENTQQNLQIIESGYQQGLNSALDVYLTRNEAHNALAKTAEQQVINTEAIRQLEQFLGQYPSGEMLVGAELPLLTTNIPLGLPSDIVARKPALMASWYRLLASDSALAYAHKQRFPSISLSASITDNQQTISDLLSGSSLAWSLLGNVAMPLFNAGKLKANEEQSRLTLLQTEQEYLSILYDAFAEVENAITRAASLQVRYQMMLTAQDNALVAQTLSFEQYQSGLEDYTTVLDAQSRAYDAQRTVIQLKNQIIVNRVNLHLALGGDFSSLSTTVIPEENAPLSATMVKD